MSQQQVRKDGKLLGTIQAVDNRLKAYSERGYYLGYYDIKTDKTYDDKHLVGHGNLLVGLIYESAVI